jgi:signal transduction histidine kinase/ligand-binding sensor domain-containing protein/DNA-binding NarL/FixJ family response regulator
MHARRVAFLAVAVIVAIASRLPAFAADAPTQDDKAAFTVLSLKDGLPNASVSGIVQDTKGFIWMASQGGLCRFDGSGFKSFENEPFNDNSLSGNLVQTLFLDSGDVLWIGTYNGLNRLDIAEERFTRFMYDATSVDSLSNDLVIAITRDARGSLWIGTLNGLNRLDEKAGTFKRYFHDAADPHSIPNNTIRALYRDSKGRLWIGTTDGGLASYDYEQDRFDTIAIARDGKPGLPRSLSLQAIAEDGEGNLWLGAWGAGLVRYSPQRGSFELLKLPDDRIYVLNTQDPAAIRVGTWGGGLYILDKTTRKLTSYRSSRALGVLPNDVVYSILQDASGELWIGTNGGGVARMDRMRRSFTAYVADQNDSAALPNGKVLATHVDRSGRLWASVYGAGVHVLDEATGKWRHYRHSASDPASLGDDICNYIFEDSRGRLWVGTNNGLSLLLPDESGFVTMRHEEGNANSLGSNIVYSVLEDPSGDLWIGTYTTGLDRWDRATGKFTHYAFDPNDGGSISDNLVNGLAYDWKGRLWVGTNNGLNRFEGGKFIRYHYDAQRKDGISSNAIQRIYNDSKGILWITTRGGGIMRYRPEIDGFSHYTRRDGLPNNIVYSVLEDRTGDLWIVTQTGIALYDRESGAIKRVTLYKELENASFNTGSCAGPEGELYFGSMGVITKFDPARYETNGHMPPVFITELKAAGLSKLATPVAIVPADTPLKLARWENSVEFRFAALDFRDPGANQFAYKLEGFDKNWTFSSTRNFATYTNLPGGRYVFRVRAANNDGLWNETGAAFPFRVAISPFLTLPAFALYLLAIALVGYGIAQLRSSRLLSQKVAELTDAQDALRSSEEEAKRLAAEADRANRAKSDFIATVSHEIRTPMNGVIGMAELLSRTRLDARQTEYVETIHRSGESLLCIINDVLDFSKIEAERVVLEEVGFDIRELVERVHAAFAHPAEHKALSFRAETAAEVPSRFVGDPLRLGQVLSNLVGNAIKFTDRGEVRIIVDIAEGDSPASPPRGDGAGQSEVRPIRFRVIDTGIGIQAERLSSLFAPFTQADQSTTRRYGGTGLGLAISKRFVELMGGTIEVTSEFGQGSTFTFTVPLGEAAAEEEPGDAQTHGESPGAGAEAGAREEGEELAGRKILVVDDDPVNRRVASRLLALLGAAATEVESGHAAIAELGRERYDAVLMDCSMPGMDGFETSLRIRDPASGVMDPRLPIVAMTARAQADDRQRCFAAGMDGYVAKPVVVETLRRSLKAVLGEGPARPEAAQEAEVFEAEEFETRYAEDTKLADEILGLFVAQARPLFEEARVAFSRGDLKALGEGMHKLKGSSGAIGATRTSAAADRAMKAALASGAQAERSHAALPGLLADLEEELGKVEEAISEYRKAGR